METEKDRIPYIERVKLDKEAYAAWKKEQYQRHLNREIKRLKVMYGQD